MNKNSEANKRRVSINYKDTLIYKQMFVKIIQKVSFFEKKTSS